MLVASNEIESPSREFDESRSDFVSLGDSTLTDNLDAIDFFCRVDRVE